MTAFPAAAPNHPEALLEEPQAFQAVGEKNNKNLAHGQKNIKITLIIDCLSLVFYFPPRARVRTSTLQETHRLNQRTSTSSQPIPPQLPSSQSPGRWPCPLGSSLPHRSPSSSSWGTSTRSPSRGGGGLRNGGLKRREMKKKNKGNGCLLCVCATPTG